MAGSTVTRGVILFAFNSEKFNYYDIAEFTAKRINHFLNLPVTLITDEESFPDTDYNWDKVIKVVPDKDNFREWGQWINKGRFMAYDLTPYEETMVLDVDYIVNSDKLLGVFDFYDDFCCHNRAEFLMMPDVPQEILSTYSYNSVWATVMAFKKTKRTEQIFRCMEMVQKNYKHYECIHNFIGSTYRNDYALSLALRMVNGHCERKEDYIPWNLVHAGKKTFVYADSADEFNTNYTVIFDAWVRNKIKKEYITLKDMDFHVLDKELFAEIING